MKNNLGTLIDARFDRLDRRHEYLRGKVHGADLRSDSRGIWSPVQAKAQLERAVSVQRRARQETQV